MAAVDRDRLARLAQAVPQSGGRFFNLERTPPHGLRDFLRWQWQTRGQRVLRRPFPVRTPDLQGLQAPEAAPRLTWIGHSTFLFQQHGLGVLTDPVLSARASPLSFVGPRRVTPPALTVAQLPPIQLVLISHNHYDHLDRATVQALHARFGGALTWCIPQGTGPWFARQGIHGCIELGWWQGRSVRLPQGHGEVFFLPTQHFSGRTARDGNRSLWGSWLLDLPGFRLWFAGDTGYGGVFRTLGELFPGIDLALIPIGAYEPRWLMAPVHVNPAEAVRIHQDVGAARSVAMHWGSFILTDEPLDAPPRDLRRALAAAGVSVEDFLVLAHGETIPARPPGPR